MDALPVIQPARKNRKALFWILAALTIAFLAFLHIAYILHGFYLDTATLAPGTGIRPMALNADLLVTGGGAILFGGVCALIGGIVSLIQRRQLLIVFAILTGMFTWIPMFYGQWGFSHVIELRKLVCEP